MPQLPSKPAPYTFVPVVTGEDRTPPVFDAVFHDGKSDQDLLSGELRCELTALTPLFVGHFQHKIDQREDIESTSEENIVRLDQSWGNGLAGRRVKRTKGFREPLFVGGNTPETSRVVIPGSSLKGMLRQNIGAMFGAPMERVQEQYFSYRPNMKWNDNNNTARYQCRMAIVREADLSCNKLVIDMLPADAQRARFDDNCPNNPTPFGYVGGLDGQAILAKGNRVHETACVRSRDFEEVTVSKAVVSHYRVTQSELSNLSYGHVSRRTDLDEQTRERASAAILENRDLQPNQMIYVEWDNSKEQVVSLGHNFYYRWRFSDSILKKFRALPKSEHERQEVASPETEVMDSEGGALTGARLLFGYVDGADEAASKADGSRKLGIVKEESKDTDAARLSGRVAINAAVEYFDRHQSPSLDERFITRDRGEGMGVGDYHRYTIPLKILGQPKASAVEHYIQQNGNKMKTYGDLPGTVGDETAGDLNGRKFYRHQQQAKTNHSLFEDNERENIETDQSGFIQFVSKPDTKFRFTVRFKGLRSWELGAVMLALAPHLRDEKCANKLGYGRPLGLGSVNITLCETLFLNNKGMLEKADVSPEDLIAEFDKVAKDNNLDDHVNNWQKVLNYQESVEAAYPAINGHIYNYHTQIRQEYCVNRRNGSDMKNDYGQPVQPGYRGRRR